ncbi:MAG: acetyl-CoA carboxylase biotin carboxylase subunit [Lachnospirales bacterium]
MFNKILIVNRGEIAVRIIRACREMGIKTVAVYSTADEDALHTQLADEAICIGSAKSSDSYLNMTNILSACIVTKAEAIHPGFGFLSENKTFARLCEECNIEFIGPSADLIELMGDKSNARETMIKAGVPVVPGSDGVVEDVSTIHDFCEKFGFPILIKASSGGGGKGIRLVNNFDEIDNNFYSAKQEAKLAFGDDSVYIERVVTNARHIEVQILGDKHGNICHLYERDCSLQRRNQKVIEEAPAFILSDEKREEICDLAVKAGKAVGYENAGTIEFLYEPKSKNIYFMEMNTRIQVEHPITELVTGIDIVQEQLKVAFGLPLSFKQEDIKIDGFAIECRVNAEDPFNNFQAEAGTIQIYLSPSGPNVRVDSCAYQGYKIPPFYDSMIAKIIVKGKTRDEAIMRMRRALYECVVEGVKTNIDFHNIILDDENYLKCDFDTKYLEREILPKLSE